MPDQVPDNPLGGMNLQATPQDFARMFRVPPKAAIAAWEKRTLPKIPTPKQRSNAARGEANPTAPWKSTDVMWHGHSRAFFVARMTRADILADIHHEVDRAIREGRTFDQFRRDLVPKLKDKGWWSAKEPDQKSLVRNPRTGKDEWARLGTPRRLRMIYQTNLAVSYDVGNYRAMDSLSDLLPYQRYHTLDHGKNRRPTHQALDGRVFRSDDPILDSIRPRNGWGCQCAMDAITKRMAEKLGPLPEATPIATKRVKVGDAEVEIRGVDLGGGRAMFPDPQWAYDPSKYQRAAEDLAWSRISRLPAPAQRVFANSIARDPALLEQRTRHWSSWVQGVNSATIKRGDTVAVGWLDHDAMDGLAAAAGRRPVSPVLGAQDGQVVHALRPAKNPKQALTEQQLSEMPAIVANPFRMVWDGAGLIVYGPERPSLKGSYRAHSRFVFHFDDAGQMSFRTAGEVAPKDLPGSSAADGFRPVVIR